MASPSTCDSESFGSSLEDSGFIQSSTPLKSTGLSDELEGLSPFEEIEGVENQQLGDKPISRDEENAFLDVDENNNVASSKAIKCRRKLLSFKPKNGKRRSWSASCSAKVRLY